MSFGISLGDFVTLIQLTTRVYRGWNDACGEYAVITKELKNLETILLRIEREVRSPASLLHHHSDDNAQLQEITANCTQVVHRLDQVVSKYRSLGTSRKGNWDRLRLGNKDLNDLRNKLKAQTLALNTYLTMLGISSLGRVENDVLPKMIKVMDGLAADIRAGRREGSVMTTYDDDDKEVWLQFRRELIAEGFRSNDIKKASPQLQEYLKKLSDAGQLEESVPEELEESLPRYQSNRNQDVSQQPSSDTRTTVESVESDAEEDEHGVHPLESNYEQSAQSGLAPTKSGDRSPREIIHKLFSYGMFFGFQRSVTTSIQSVL